MVIIPHIASGNLYCGLRRGWGRKELKVSLQIMPIFWTSQGVSGTLWDPATSLKGWHYMSLDARGVKIPQRNHSKLFGNAPSKLIHQSIEAGLHWDTAPNLYSVDLLNDSTAWSQLLSVFGSSFMGHSHTNQTIHCLRKTLPHTHLKEGRACLRLMISEVWVYGLLSPLLCVLVVR